MKITYLFIILLLMLSGLGYANLSKDQLTFQDNHNYKSTIDQSKIGKLHDTTIFKRKYRVSYITIKMTNNSNDVLNYITYSCSWDDLFHSDNKAIEVCHVPCESNYPVMRDLASHKSMVFIFPVLIKAKVTNMKFKAGMNLFFDTQQNRQLFPLPVDRLGNVIWSNEVIL